MEKAKLILAVSKKKQIIATLQFESGKTISLQRHNFRDTALNGSEVEVERDKEGRVVLVKAESNVLFSAQPSKESPQSKPRFEPATPPRSASQEKRPARPSSEPASPAQNRQFEHVSYVRNPAYAPYNFVPLNREVVEINPTIPPANKYDPKRNTGWIDLDIEAITPLYIRGTLTLKEVEAGDQETKNKSDFCSPVNKLRIPGSSLRGLTRNMVEIVSFGKFHFFEDRRLYYRGLADRSNLREEYQSRMSSYDRRARRAQYNFSVGLLRKSDKKEPGLHFEIKSSGGNFRQIYKDEARDMVQAIGKKYAEFNFYKVEEGYLVVSGDMPNKKRDWLISEPPDNAEIIEILPEDVRSYDNDRTRDERVSNLLELARQKENEKGVPCFYVRWQDARGKDRISFGHTGMFRLAYEKTIGEHVPSPLLDETKVDFAEAIFGNEKTHSGRVFFEDAFLIDEQDAPQLEAQTPQILSAPKPTTFQHYLVQSSDEVKQLNHYNSETAIRGYKFYWHKSGVRWVETERKAKETQYTQIKPVKAGTKFRGRIRFENLSDKELGALLFALDLPEGCRHKLGMGKPLGLGSIRITPKLYLSNRIRRYKDFFAEVWDNKIEASALETLKMFKDAFSKYVLQKLGEDSNKLLWETSRLRELLVMLRFDVGRELERTGANRYMSIAPQNEFKNRNVLPRAASLISPVQIDEIVANVKGQAIAEKPKPTVIKKVEIKGLWDKFDVTWPPEKEQQLDDAVNILVGINGSGKTTILELMRYALEDRYEKEVYYAPKEFIITFDNNDKIRYEEKSRVESPSHRLQVEFISTFDVAPRGEEKKKTESLSNFFKRQLTEELWDRIIRLSGARDYLLLANISPITYLEEFTEIVNDAFERPKKRIEFVGAFAIDQETVARIRKQENLPEELCTKLEGMITETPYYPGSEFVDALEGTLGRDEAARYRSRILKHVTFKQDSPPSHLIFRLNDGRVILPDQLSAGEKQMLNILLATLILKLKSLVSDEKHSVLIMDEPELSLHMRWQKALIDYIQRLNENVQIIIATHSPDILEKGWMDRALGVDEIRREVD